MNELIRINTDNSDRPTVMGRELHEALEINSNYTTWFKRMCEYGFTENSDYVTLFQKRKTAQGNESEYTDHQITLDMAKEICMIQRSDIGRKCRQYFLDVEKQWNTPEAVMERALKYADQKIKQLEKERGNLPVSSEQVSILNDETCIKAIDLCNSGRVYMDVGYTIRMKMVLTLCEKLGIDRLRDVTISQFEFALGFFRNYKPDSTVKGLIKNSRNCLCKK